MTMLAMHGMLLSRTHGRFPGKIFELNTFSDHCGVSPVSRMSFRFRRFCQL